MELHQSAILFFDATMTDYTLLLSALNQTSYRVVRAQSDVETLVRLRTGRFAALVLRTDSRGTHLLPLLRHLSGGNLTLPLLVLADTGACTAVRVARGAGAEIRTVDQIDAFEPRALAAAVEQAIRRGKRTPLTRQPRRRETPLARFERWLGSLFTGPVTPRAWRW